MNIIGAWNTVVMTHISGLDVVVCGCTKNSGSYIAAHIEKILSWRVLFNRMDVVIYENDSDDNTKAVLTGLESSGRITLISENGIDAIRTVVLAHGRNRLLSYVRGHISRKYDYMIMLDLDEAVSTLTSDMLTAAFSHDVDTWDVLTGSSPRYYDIWALRTNPAQFTSIQKRLWPRPLTYDCWFAYSCAMRARPSHSFASFKHIASYQCTMTPDMPLIEVDSAFNGIGIYKFDKLRDAAYSGVARVNGVATRRCEHVSLHAGIRKNEGRIFICPQLVVGGWEAHMA